MSAISTLPLDALAHVMLLAAPWDMKLKLELAMVSRSWRLVAVNSPLLWASFELCTRTDMRSLPVFLSRSDATALHIHVLVASEYGSMTTDATPSEQHIAVQLLVSVRHRITMLRVRHNQSASLLSLLNGGLHFGALREFVHEHNDCAPTVPLSISAPQLQDLNVEMVEPSSWDGVLGQSLVKLRISQYSLDAQLLSTILRTCPKLQELTLDAYIESRAMGLASLASPKSGSSVPALRSLNLHMHMDDILGVLDIFAGVLIASITICGDDGVRFERKQSHEPHRLMQHLMRGMRLLRTIDIRSDQDVLLVDDAGNTRRMLVDNEDSPCWNVPALWRFLVRHHDARSTVHTLRIAASVVPILAPVFSRHRPTSKRPFTLRVHLDGGFIRDVEEGRYAPGSDSPFTLSCPRASKVYLEGRLEQDAVFHLLRAIRCTSRDVEVCLCDAAGVSSKGPGLIEAVRDELSCSSEPQWTLCSHCS